MSRCGGVSKVGILFIGIFLLMIIGVSAIDIGYVVKSPDSLNGDENAIKGILELEGYDVAIENDVAFDASIYDAIIVSSSVSDTRDIFDSINHKTLFLSYSAAEKMGLGDGIGSSRRYIRIINNDNVITEGYLLDELDVYSSSTSMGYLQGCLPINAMKLAQKSSSNSDGVLVALDEGSLLIDDGGNACTDRNTLLNEKNLFFGFYRAEKWNDDGRALFLNSVEWLVGGEDLDGDGYNSLVDCDDNDASIHPDAIELMDNIDQNCVNDQPVLVSSIEDISWIKGGSYEIDLNDYFDDPEGDALSFSIFDSSSDDEIIVDINGVVASFNSPAGWAGEGWVFFKAEDGEDFKASNKIILRVFEEGDGGTCSLLNGFICSTEQVCSGSWLNAIDSNLCCSVQCSENLDFTEIDRNDNLSSELVVNIKNIGAGEKFAIGSNMDIEIEIENKGSEDLDLEVFVYLYDLTNDEIVEEISKSEGINDGDNEVVKFEMDVSRDIDEENEYAIFVKVEDDIYYNEDFVLVDIIRKDSDWEITEVKFNKDSLECGDYVDVSVKVQNWGTNGKSGYVEIENSKLKINERGDDFGLDKYDDDDDSIWETFSVQIPKGVKQDEYIITATVYFALKSDSFDKAIQVSCDNRVEDGQEVISLGEPKGVQVVKKGSKGKVVMVVGLLVLSVLLLMVSVLKVVGKKR